MNITFHVKNNREAKEEIDHRYNVLFNELKWQDISIKHTEIEAYICYDNRIGYPAVRSKVALNCSAEELYVFLIRDILATAGKWNPTFQRAYLLEQHADQEESLAMYYQKKPAREREDIFYRSFGKKGQQYYERSIGLVGHDKLPAREKKNIVRSDMYLCTKDIYEQENGSCFYDVMWHVDPKGKVSKFFPKKMVAKFILDDLIGEMKKLCKKYN